MTKLLLKLGLSSFVIDIDRLHDQLVPQFLGSHMQTLHRFAIVSRKLLDEL